MTEGPCSAVMHKEKSSWPAPANFPELQAGQVHVWRIPLIHSRDDLLSASERQRAGRFRFDHHRTRFVAGRQALRRILAGYVEADPAALAFDYLAHGKPVLAGDTDLQFNFSNSGDLGLLVAGWDLELGIDVECLHKELDPLALAGRFFCPEEMQELSSLPAALQKKAFLTAWTRKEACMKLAGDGLHIPLHDFAVNMHPDQAPVLQSGEEALGGPVSLRSLEVGAEFVASLAARVAQFECLQLAYSSDMEISA